MTKTLSVFIGRLQPPTKAHLKIIRESLKTFDYTLVLLGSANASKSTKNPLSYHDRAFLLFDIFTKDNLDGKLSVQSIDDFPGNDSLWVQQVTNKIDRFKTARNISEVYLIGHSKDETSYYLNLFPTFKSHNCEAVLNDKDYINATDLRKIWFERGFENIPDYFFEGEEHKSVLKSNDQIFIDLKSTYEYNKKYKEDTRFVNLPFPPTFQCADAVVEVSGHILMITRKFDPGIGMLALPGGYVNINETIKDAMIRELIEETKIKVPEKVLRGSIINQQIFDDPNRSERGRIITEAYHIKLDSSQGFPRIYGSDDAAKAHWIPVNDIYAQSRNVFEDHLHIIKTLINKATI